MATSKTSPLPAVLVTGAGQRLGADIARRFAAEGWHVVIHYRDSAEDAARMASQLPSAEIVQFDLADTADVEQAVSAMAQRLPRWSALVNSASLFEPDEARRIDDDVFDRAMATNARGCVHLAQAFLAHATSVDGRCVINVLDQKLANMNPDFFSYTMAKAALGAATEMLAMAYADTQDRIYGLAPGAMLPSHDQAEEAHQVSGRMNLLSRLTLPDELADAATFLATGAAQSGTVIYVDSGQHLLNQDRDVLYLAREDG